MSAPSDRSRIDAATRAITAHRRNVEYANDGALARCAIDAADQVDILRIPHGDLGGLVPLVLYFQTRADADQFVALVREALPGRVGVQL